MSGKERKRLNVFGEGSAELNLKDYRGAPLQRS
jgi:hypothetical protein